VLQQPCSFA